MARRRKRGGRRLAGLRGAGIWGGLALLLVAVGWLLVHLGRDLPDETPSPLAGIEALVGPLRTSGVRVRVADAGEARSLAARVRGAAAGTGLVVSPEVAGEGELSLRLRDRERDYPLAFFWPPPVPRLAVVIDDIGRNRAEAIGFLELRVPVTLAILPHQPHSAEVATLARSRGREFLLHLPMEPQGYPSTNPGEGALLSGMSESRVRELVESALRAVPGVSGVNNHMGSRLTEQEEPMRWVMEELRRRGLYFLDSLTSPRSVAGSVAAQAGLAWARRDVFLDNVREESAVRAQFRRAVERAKAAGRAVAIGHGNDVTLRVLRDAEPMLQSTGVRVVPLREVLQGGGGA